MNDEIREKLEKALSEKLDELNNWNPQEEDGNVDNIVKLYELYLEDSKVSTDKKHRRNELIAKLALEAGMFAIGLLVSNMWMNKGYKFEETGTLVSSVFRNFWSKQNPIKK